MNDCPVVLIDRKRGAAVMAVLLVLGGVSSTAIAGGADPAITFRGATPLEWSVRMANSEVARRGDSLAWKEGGKAKWDYATGLFTLSLLKLDSNSNQSRYRAFVESTIGSFITADGQIHAYKPAEYQLDHINPGKTVLALYRLTGEERYRKAAGLLHKQFETQPRTRSGGYWHKQRYPHQMWLDGIYMAAPFQAEYAALFEKRPEATFDEIARQIRLMTAHAYDPGSGLFYHGWDESKSQDWANKSTGLSSNFWGRAIGWYGMALVDVLDWFPTHHPARPEIIRILQQLNEGVLRWQDRESGLWYQVLDKGGREGNYVEATASSMFVYVLAKSANSGYAPTDSRLEILKAYRGVIERLMKQDSEGRVSLTRCCSVAGLGYGRDGSYEYYIREPVVENDLKGVGPFIMAGLELQRMLKLP